MAKNTNTITAKKRRYMLNLANELADMAAKCICPGTRRRIYTAANYARKEYGYSNDQKRDEVLMRVRSGAGTVRDIELETGLSAESIREALADLLATGAVCRTRMRYGSGPGKPQFLYEIVENGENVELRTPKN